MAAGNAERVEKDRQRKLEIQRQEQLLSGRIVRAKTEEHGDPSGRGPGIQIYHYKDPGARDVANHDITSVNFSEVEQIVKNTKKEEIRRRMSHGELLRGFNNGMSNGFNNGSSNGFNNGFNNGMNNGSFNGSDVQSTNGEEEKTVFFDAQVGK